MWTWWWAATLVPCFAGFTEFAIALYNPVVDAVLDIWALILLPREQALVVGFVFGEKQRRFAFAVKRHFT